MLRVCSPHIFLVALQPLELLPEYQAGHECVLRPVVLMAVSAWHAGFAGQQIRLRGKNMTENEHVKLGAYHTLEIEQQRPFTLYKQEWDLLDLERIRQACDPAASADLAAVLITVNVVHFGGLHSSVNSRLPSSILVTYA